MNAKSKEVSDILIDSYILTRLSNKIGNSLLAVKKINRKYIVVGDPG